MRRILMACFAIALSASGVAPVITGLDLLDADTGALIAPLQNGDTLDLNQLGQRAFWVQAQVSGSGSVHFQEGRRIDRVVNDAPYMLGGSVNGTNGAWMPAPGFYTLIATPWEGADATGEPGTPVEINLTVVDGLSHRMRPVRILSDIPDAQVNIRMLEHAFPFGSMTKPGIEQPGMYQDVFLSNFNCSVVGNDMKWYANQPDWWNQSPHNTGYAKPGNWRYDNADIWLDFMDSQGIPARGHTIFWGEKGASKQTPTDMMQDPDWVEALGTNALYWIEQRASNIVSRYAGRIDEWDFNNELWHGDWYRDTFGPSITKQMADWAVAANPNIKLWFNEYNMLNNSNNADAFRAHLQMLQSEGVQIDGVGVQGHFGGPPNAVTVKASLDILDDLGVPIKITEFDCGSTNMTETQMADGLETVYRAGFEHPAVEGIMMWGFWEANHWRPERALWKTDWTPTEQAFRYQELVFDEWWSQADLLTDQNGEFSVHLFAGDFEITIDGKVFTNSITAGAQTLNYVYTGTELIEADLPQVALTAPGDGTAYPSGTPVSLSAAAFSSNSSIAFVELYADGQLLKTDSVAPYTAVVYDLPSGSHVLRAVAVDANGFFDTSEPVNLSIMSGNGNLIDNPGFESGTTGWKSHGGHSIGTVSSPVYEGSAAGRAFARDNPYDGLAQDLTDKLVPGETYVIWCYARLDVEADEAGMVLKTSYSTNSPTYKKVASGGVDAAGWTQIKGEFTFQPDPLVTEALIYIANVAVGTEIFVDSVFCTEATLATLDYDSDGMPDQWEETHFGSIDAVNGGAFDDWDGDGVANRAELRCGTDPTDFSSRLAVTSLEPFSEQMVVGWQSVSNKSYRILTSTNLVEGGWNLIAEGLEASGTNLSYAVEHDADQTFMRVELDE